MIDTSTVRIPLAPGLIMVCEIVDGSWPMPGVSTIRCVAVRKHYTPRRRPDIARQSWRQSLLQAAGIPGAYAETGTRVACCPPWRRLADDSRAILLWCARLGLH